MDYAYWKRNISLIGKPKFQIQPFFPKRRQVPNRSLPVVTAWKGIETILVDIFERFHVSSGSCLEFGVEHGYSTVALSSYFDSVVGVDTFTGDKHTGSNQDMYAETFNRLSEFKNISLVRSNYQNWILNDNSFYDLIHVDIVHTYRDTYDCGIWSARHSSCTLFHDTESFPAVKLAVADIARSSNKTFYNFTESNGLGILV